VRVHWEESRYANKAKSRQGNQDVKWEVKLSEEIYPGRVSGLKGADG